MKKVDEARIEGLLKELSLEEKISMIHGSGLFQTSGVDRLGIPELKMSDGPMGVRMEFARGEWRNICTSDDYVSYLPSNSAIAATWNREIAYESGKSLGAEARGRGKDVILAPGINIKRGPLCGRNFEYMSEDPRLIEEMAAPLIRGIQENDVAACVKHFAANNQETERLSVDTQLDERTLNEIYFPGFKSAIEEGETISIMGAYNRLYGEHCCHSKYLLNGILRKEWGYNGAIISDWGGVHDTREAAESALDLEMSVHGDFDNYYMANPLLEAVKAGEIEESHVDEKVRNILRMMLRLNMLGEDREQRKPGAYNAPVHREKALACARESVILLKNEDGRLPIKKEGLKTLAVIGHNAQALHANGGGSAEIKALYEISPLLALRSKLGGNVQITYAPGYYVPNNNDADPSWQLHSLEQSEPTQEVLEKKEALKKEIKAKGADLLTEAVALAKRVDEVIVIGGLNHEHDVEGKDREEYELPYGQDELIKAVLEANPRAVVIMLAGSPVRMADWSDKAQAIVWSWYAGMEGGTALAEVLLGEVNPSGKLPETILKELMDCPAHKLGEFAKKKEVIYKEGVFVGYRYYDTHGTQVEFPFGHGLSYTNFSYEDLKISVDEQSGLNVKVEFTLRNTGDFDGAEVIQIYVRDDEASVERPIHELKDFDKLYLKAGESRKVERILTQRDFGFYDIEKKSFHAESGDYEIQIGSSSRDIRLKEKIRLSGEYLYS